jgi:hypothetical protein
VLATRCKSCCHVYILGVPFPGLVLIRVARRGSWHCCQLQGMPVLLWRKWPPAVGCVDNAHHKWCHTNVHCDQQSADVLTNVLEYLTMSYLASEGMYKLRHTSAYVVHLCLSIHAQRPCKVSAHDRAAMLSTCAYVLRRDEYSSRHESSREGVTSSTKQPSLPECAQKSANPKCAPANWVTPGLQSPHGRMPFAAFELMSVRIVLGWKGARRHAGALWTAHLFRVPDR